MYVNDERVTPYIRWIHKKGYLPFSVMGPFYVLNYATRLEGAPQAQPTTHKMGPYRRSIDCVLFYDFDYVRGCDKHTVKIRLTISKRVAITLLYQLNQLLHV